MGSDISGAYSAHPWQNKSPTGRATAGSPSWSSQVIRKTRVRQASGRIVSHRCRITPAPSISARSARSPAPITRLGDTFQPKPRSRAALAPVPSVARAPAPRAPVGFSAVMARLSDTGKPGYVQPSRAIDRRGMRSASPVRSQVAPATSRPGVGGRRTDPPMIARSTRTEP